MTKAFNKKKGMTSSPMEPDPTQMPGGGMDPSQMGAPAGTSALPLKPKSPATAKKRKIKKSKNSKKPKPPKMPKMPKMPQY